MAVPVRSLRSMSDIISHAQVSEYFDYEASEYVKLNLVERIVRAVLSVFGLMNSSEIRCRQLTENALMGALQNPLEGRITKRFVQELKDMAQAAEDEETDIGSLAQVVNLLYSKEFLGLVRATLTQIGHDEFARNDAAQEQKSQAEQAHKQANAAQLADRIAQLQIVSEQVCRQWVMESAQAHASEIEAPYCWKDGCEHHGNVRDEVPGQLWNNIQDHIVQLFDLNDCKEVGNPEAYAVSLVKHYLDVSNSKEAAIPVLQCHVKQLDGRIITCEVRSGQFGFQLKQQLSDKEGGSPSSRKLIFNGKPFHPGMPLSDLFKSENEGFDFSRVPTVHIVYKMR